MIEVRKMHDRNGLAFVVRNMLVGRRLNLNGRPNTLHLMHYSQLRMKWIREGNANLTRFVASIWKFMSSRSWVQHHREQSKWIRNSLL